VTDLACTFLQLTTVPIHTALPPSTKKHICSETDSQILVIDAEVVPEFLTQVLDAHTTLIKVVVVIGASIGAEKLQEYERSFPNAKFFAFLDVQRIGLGLIDKQQQQQQQQQQRSTDSLSKPSSSSWWRLSQWTDQLNELQKQRILQSRRWPLLTKEHQTKHLHTIIYTSGMRQKLREKEKSFFSSFFYKRFNWHS
jgi:long-subunit acyl-CoA synthetase (AMP-forming)